MKEIFGLDETPEIGQVPKKMHAWTIRKERFGEPIQSFQEEIVEVPSLLEDEILVYNMVAGVNFNGVWAGLGEPKNVIESQKSYGENVDFHICGSESTGIVYAVGENVTKFKIGDPVIVVGSQYDAKSAEIQQGIDPILTSSYRIWGYESNWGAFAQYSKVKECQCVIKPDYVSWTDGAAISATGITAHRMLTRWDNNAIQKGDVVLIWGGCGGLGSIAIQIVNYYGGIPVAVVSSEERAKECMRLGAKGCINRKKYTHWGRLDGEYKSKDGEKKWLRQALKFRSEIWKIVGERKNPKIVLEHVGEDTLPTSLFVCDKGGMVVLCGGTTGYVGSIDLRYLWLSQKRVQGCHAGTASDLEPLLQMQKENKIKPFVSKVYEYSETAIAHQEMYENKDAVGKVVIRIGLKE